MRLSLFFLIAGMLVSSISPAATERRYIANMEDSSWELTERSRIMCRLEHQIPRFGKLVFTQEPGRGLQMKLQTIQNFEKGINVELRSEQNHWNDSQDPMLLARFETTGRKDLFKIPPVVAAQTFDELARGFQPGFLFYEDYPLIASVSSVRFGSQAESFNLCISQLHRDNFYDVRVTSILFGPDEEFASIEQEETAFLRMFEYLKIDDSVSKLVITGHTDRTGNACYNEGLSERRALYVYDLLVALGMDSKKLQVGYQGESRPKHKGSASKSLAANRRVTVELQR